MKIVNKLKKISLTDVLFPLILSLIFCVPIYFYQMRSGIDLSFHASRIVGLAKGLQAHDFPVYIYPYINNGYGYGSPLFYCDMFLLLPALLYLMGLPIIVCIRIFIFVFSLIMAYLSYYVAKQIFEDNKIKYLTSTMYCFSNIVFVYYYVTSGLGNICALAFLPLLLLSWYKFFIKKEACPILMGVSFGLLLISHILTFTLGVIFFVLFIIIDVKSMSKNRLLEILKAAVIGMCLSAFFLFPLIEQLLSQEFYVSYLKDTTNKIYLTTSQVSSIKDILGDYFIYIFKGASEVISRTYIGVLCSIGTLIIYILYKVNKKEKFNEIDILFIIVFLGVIIQLDVIPLDNLTFLYDLQFLWRLYVYIVPFSIYVFCKVFTKLNLKNILIPILCLYYIINFVGLNISLFNDSLTNNDATYESLLEYGAQYISYKGFNISEIGQGEYLPMTSDYDYFDNQDIEFANGDVVTSDYIRVGTTITFTTDYEYAEYLYLPISWYKGYYYKELDENGDVISEKECGYSLYTKRVEIYKEEGTHTFEVYYKGTLIQKVSLAISIVTGVGLMVYLLKFKSKKLN